MRLSGGENENHLGRRLLVCVLCVLCALEAEARTAAHRLGQRLGRPAPAPAVTPVPAAAPAVTPAPSLAPAPSGRCVVLA